MLDPEFLVGFVPAPLLLLHTFSMGHILLRPPMSTVFGSTFPLFALAATLIGYLDLAMLQWSACLLVPHAQWLAIRLLYGRFMARHGRPPRDVFLRAPEVPDSGPDAALLFSGLIVLVLLPASLIWLAKDLSMRFS